MKESIKDFFVKEIEIQTCQNNNDFSCVKQLGHYRQIQAMLKQFYSKLKTSDVFNIFITIWGNDFDPNYNTQYRGSVFIPFSAISCPHMGANQQFNIYPICIGPNNNNHNVYQNYYKNNWKKLIWEISQFSYHLYNKILFVIVKRYQHGIT